MIGEEDVLKPESAEQPGFLYSKVVFGHPFDQFDRDQLIAWYIATKIGVLSPTAPAEFSLPVPESALASPNTLVIEGVPNNGTWEKNNSKGNFDNGPGDAPAAAMLTHVLSRKVTTSPDSQKIRDLVGWLTSVERGKPMKKPLQTLRPEDLSQLTNIFMALKGQHNQPGDLLSNAHILLDNVFNTDENRRPLREIYAQYLSPHQSERGEKFDRLKERAKDKKYLKTTRTQAGINLAYFDVRGLGSEEGAFSVAVEHSDADIVMLIDDHKDANGEVRGTQIKIKIPKQKEESQPINLTQLLAERLNTSESLFGKGYEFIVSDSYGGHPGIVGSPRSQGSDLDPEKVWYGISDFFDVPRYSETDFTQKALEFAEKMGTGNIYPNIEIIPSDAYHLSKRAMTIVVPSGDQPNAITISEDDLPIYEEACTDDISHNQAVLLQKTESKEAEIISALRHTRALSYLGESIDRSDTEGILKALNQLDPKTIQSLPKEEMLSIIQEIAHADDAIDAVWNKDNLQFGITYKPLPDWIKNSIEMYKRERYSYNSLPKKVDTYLLQRAESVVAKGSKEEQQRYAETLMTIVTSERYKQTHIEGSYDTLLQSVLRLTDNSNIQLDIRTSIIEALLSEYGHEQSTHWRDAVQKDPLLVGRITQQFPQFDEFLQTMGITLETKEIGDIPNSILIEPDRDRIKAHCDYQREQGLEPYATILVEIGDQIEQQIKAQGISRMEQSEPGVYRNESDVTVDAAIHINSTLRLDREHSDHQKVAREVVRMVKQIASMTPDEHTPIRIIRGRFPGILAGAVATELMRQDSGIDSGTQQRIIWCDFNQQEQQYFDTPLLS